MKMKKRKTGLTIRSKFPNTGWIREIQYRGYVIHLYEDNFLGEIMGNMSIYDPNGRERLHATLAAGAALKPEVEVTAKRVIDEMIAGDDQT